jgi:hypothetical protein
MRKDLPKNSKTFFEKVENTARGCWLLGRQSVHTWEGCNLDIYHFEQKHFNATLISTVTSDNEIQVQIRHYSPKDQSFHIQPWHSNGKPWE